MPMNFAQNSMVISNCYFDSFLIHLWLSNEIKHLHSGDQPLFLIYKGHNFEIKNLKVWQLDNLLEVGICSSEVIFIHLYKQK